MKNVGSESQAKRTDAQNNLESLDNVRSESQAKGNTARRKHTYTDAESVLLARMLHMLARRDHSIHEIRTKFLNKGEPSDSIERVISHLEQQGLLDDARFAIIYARHKGCAGSKSWGVAKIRASLAQKGVEKSYIEKAVEEVQQHQHQDDELMKVARSVRVRLMRTEQGPRRKKKLVDFLMRRGFPQHLVFERAEELLSRITDEQTHY